MNPDGTRRGPVVLTDAKGIVVQEVTVPGDDGPESRALILHPGAVVLLPVLGDGRLLLIANRRYSLGEVLIEAPAGTLEPGEDPVACAHREVVEETGYAAATLTSLGRFYAAPGYCTEELHAYLATDLTYEGQDLDPCEDIDVQPLTDAACRAMVADGRIRDAKTLAILTLYWLRVAARSEAE